MFEVCISILRLNANVPTLILHAGLTIDSVHIAGVVDTMSALTRLRTLSVDGLMFLSCFALIYVDSFTQIHSSMLC